MQWAATTKLALSLNEPEGLSPSFLIKRFLKPGRLARFIERVRGIISTFREMGDSNNPIGRKGGKRQIEGSL
jgi:hypothetical protein